MDFLRRALYTLLGKGLYFRVVSRSFLILYRLGLLKLFTKFGTHYLVRSLIRKDDVIIDIGANFGYYTSIFSRAVGKNGKVYAVEPVKLYRDILMSNTIRRSNIDLVPYALSDSEGDVEMGLPEGQMHRHGLTKIMDNETGNENQSVYSVATKTPDTVFGKLTRLDYIKCDIEGHESKVIPGFKNLIEKFNPIIQIELEKANFDPINILLTSSGYTPYALRDRRIVQVQSKDEIMTDIIYLPENRKQDLRDIFKL